ncbi:MAG: outer membrane lipoprotein-sorting protein [Pseudomonadales bacterium]|nr:outer membrane lipoprotein-sorting protein [Pseudomonadales bacterium]
MLKILTQGVLVIALSLNVAFAFELKGSAAEKGLAIAQESERRNTGWQDSRATMKMTLKNKAGDTSERDISIKSLEVEDDGDKSLTVFNSPRDVKGTAFLSFSHAVTPDEQWLYLPALKRVKRIASKNKSGPFMGSEFAFEDLSSFEVEKYTYNYLGTEQVNGLDCYKSELTPAYKHSGYSKTIAWIDQEEFRIQKIEYYDRKKKLLKTQTFHDYKKYLDQFWRAHKMVMTNHQVGKSTELLWSDYQFRTGLNDKDFNKNSLKRAR